MQVGMVAFHYPRPEYRDQMLGRVQRASWFIEATPGCLAIDCWLTEDGAAIVSTGRWDSEEALQAGFAAARAGGVDFTYDNREARPREVFRLAHTGPLRRPCRIAMRPLTRVPSAGHLDPRTPDRMDMNCTDRPHPAAPGGGR